VRLLAALTVVLAATALGASASGATRAQLALMVLPHSQLGPGARGLEVAIGSGYLSNAVMGSRTLDPNDAEPQLDRAGRVTGYSLGYLDVAYANLARGAGLIAVESDVDLYRSPAAVDARLATQLGDAQRFRGKRVDNGQRLLDSGSFAVTGLDTNAIGVLETIAYGSARYHATIVSFRAGPLLATVGVTRADAKPATSYALGLASALAERIRRVETGAIAGASVPVPPTAASGEPPAGGPDLARMALFAGDLPSGATLTRAGYLSERESLGFYDREFEFGATRAGGERYFAAAASQIRLLRTPAEARGLLRTVDALYASPDAGRALTGGFSVTDVSVERRLAVSAGDEALGVVLRMRWNDEDLCIAQVVVRVGRVVGLLDVDLVGSTFDRATVLPLATKLARRIRAGL
jgi:hypothetical protein